MTYSSPAKKAPPVCQIFCKAIDNYGDFGVCWRLARQLSAEYGADVTIWLDDFTVLSPWLSAGSATHMDRFSVNPDGASARLQVQPWNEADPHPPGQSPVTLLIEAFACELPATYIRKLQQIAAPLWINLEYLSAEDWIRDCHGLYSMHPSGRQKLFFFPGFVPGTGGLLRERGLADRHLAWQRDRELTRAQVFSTLGIEPPVINTCGASTQSDCLIISAFTYESAAFASWLDAMSRSGLPILLLMPPGRLPECRRENRRVLESLPWNPGVQGRALQPGDRAETGALRVQIIPFQSQDEYDRLLTVCDLNLVRGEDSFVRAQWAGMPMLWHIYPQEENAHLNKLAAFLDLYTACTDVATPVPGRAFESLRAFWLDWNLGQDCHISWSRFAAALPLLQRHASLWREYLLKQPDLSSNLMNFYENQL